MRMAITRVLALGLTLAWLATAAPADDRPLAFGVLNQQSPARTAERWNPILHYVTTHTGVPLQLRMGPTVQDTDAMMGRGEFEFMFTNHNFQTEFDSIGYRVIARWAGEAIRGVIAAPASSPARSLKDLDGRRVAFPSMDAFVGYAVPMVALRQAGVKVEPVFAGNQEGVLAQLKAGRVDAGAVNSRFLAQYSKRERVAFRELLVSQGYPDLAVIVHARVPAATVDKVRQALLGMKDDPAAAPILTRAESPGFEAATDRDYDGVRQVYRLIGQ
jgi:phosphonate transport system substrate-binding protein